MVGIVYRHCGITAHAIGFYMFSRYQDALQAETSHSLCRLFAGGGSALGMCIHTFINATLFLIRDELLISFGGEQHCGCITLNRHLAWSFCGKRRVAFETD